MSITSLEQTQVEYQIKCAPEEWPGLALDELGEAMQLSQLGRAALDAELSEIDQEFIFARQTGNVEYLPVLKRSILVHRHAMLLARAD